MQKIYFLFFFTFISFLLIISVGCNQAEKAEKSENEDWVALFNGKDLSGWDLKIAGEPLNENYKNTIRVEDSMLRVVYDEYKTFDDKFGHLYYQQPFSHYKLRFQYRFTGNQTPGGAEWNVRNSGVMIHSQSAKSVEIDQDFPVSLEVQLLGGLNEGERPTGNLCTPGTWVHMGDTVRMEHVINSSSKTYNGDRWVNVAVEVYGDSLIRHMVEGDTVLTYTKPKVGGGFVSETHNWEAAHIKNSKIWTDKDNTPLKEGYIALQAESHPIDFKKIELLNLEGCTDKTAKNYKSYYIKSDNSKCLY